MLLSLAGLVSMVLHGTALGNVEGWLVGSVYEGISLGFWFAS